MKTVQSTMGHCLRRTVVALCVVALISTIPGSAAAQNLDPVPDPILIEYAQLELATDNAEQAMLEVLIQLEKDTRKERRLDHVFSKVMAELVLKIQFDALAAEQAYRDMDEAREKYELAMTGAATFAAFGIASAAAAAASASGGCSTCDYGNLRSDLQVVIDLTAKLRLQARKQCRIRGTLVCIDNPKSGS